MKILWPISLVLLFTVSELSAWELVDPAPYTGIKYGGTADDDPGDDTPPIKIGNLNSYEDCVQAVTKYLKYREETFGREGQGIWECHEEDWMK